ncbi:hypothetical protein SAMN02910263_03925 [Butyrivibrio sp. INlla16]|nr:hypothetical protein SAMN02910263_03925 [Butyrivibrio sp. INlla16]SEM03622.1 hypothetical protein SAMN04487770_1249 [Butyrivibrio sp. ob235]
MYRMRCREFLSTINSSHVPLKRWQYMVGVLMPGVVLGVIFER